MDAYEAARMTEEEHLWARAELYALIAKVFATVRPEVDAQKRPDAWSMWYRLRDTLAVALSQNDEEFDHIEFNTASDVGAPQ